ncbi:MAG: hypothetical protein HWD60_03015 [Defluviicoccus sp.]|nr:MAG: hypothetical protein HWD60_03015 [Defluviicoccus sp.]
MLTRIHDISADLLMAEGHCDEAFATWRESVLPVQQKSGNKRAALVTRSKMLDAQLHSQEATAELRTEAEALLNAGKAQQELDAIAWTHKSAGALLAALGEARQAVPLLRRAAEAFERIGWPTQASLAREQADEIDAEDSCIDPNEG